MPIAVYYILVYLAADFYMHGLYFYFILLQFCAYFKTIIGRHLIVHYVHQDEIHFHSQLTEIRLMLH